MRKSAEAFRTISEVAETLAVPKHVLRFWEIKFPQIRPMKRGGGRRYYRPEDVELLSGIRALLHADGYTIKGVQKILKEQGPEYAKAYGRGEVGAAHEVAKATVAKNTAVTARSAKGSKVRRGAPKSAPPRGSLPDAVAQVVSELEDCRIALRAAIAGKTGGIKPAAGRSRGSRRVRAAAR